MSTQDEYFVGMADWQLDRLLESNNAQLAKLTNEEKTGWPIHPAVRLKGQIRAEFARRRQNTQCFT